MGHNIVLNFLHVQFLVVNLVEHKISSDETKETYDYFSSLEKHLLWCLNVCISQTK